MFQVVFTEQGSAQAFHVSHEVTILGLSLYVAGIEAGPHLIGPLSEVYGMSQISHSVVFNELELGRKKPCMQNILCFILHLHVPSDVCS